MLIDSIILRVKDVLVETFGDKRYWNLESWGYADNWSDRSTDWSEIVDFETTNSAGNRHVRVTPKRFSIAYELHYPLKVRKLTYTGYDKPIKSENLFSQYVH